MALLICPFLVVQSRAWLACLNSSWQHWELFGDCPVAHPRPPLCRRQYGFGQTNPILKISHSEHLVYFILHLTWDFLLPEERFKLTDKLPVFLDYAWL
jgi:hypothetical protein